MAFSLSKLFKGKPGATEAEPTPGTNAQGEIPAPAAPPAAPPPAASAVRTVLPSHSPNSPAPVSLRTPGAPIPSVPGGAKPPVTRNLPIRPPVRKVSFPVPTGATPATTTIPRPTAVPPPISMSAPPPPTPRVPVSFAPAPMPVPPAPDVSVQLAVGDFLDRIPPGFLKGGEVDRSRVVEFRASELYSDLAKGKASVPASTIYTKCPEIFARAVSDEEDAEIQLPLQKLVEQLSAAFTTRIDQVAEENVGEIETPFLQVANEDSVRLPKALGTSAGAIRPVADLPIAPPTEATASNGIPQRPAHRTGTISTISPKPAPEPIPAPTFTPPTSASPINPGKRPPSTVRASVAGGKIRLSGAAAVTRIVPAPSVPPVAPPPGEDASVRQAIPAPPSAPTSASPSHQVTKKTARIQIPPISLRAGGVGAASRPGSIPPPPSVPVQPSPVSIRPPTEAIPPVSFRTSPPPPPAVKPPKTFLAPPSFAPPRANFPPPTFPAVPPGGGTPAPAAPPAAAAPAAPADDRKIELGLAAVLRGQPSAALTVEPSSVPDSVRVTLPFPMIEKQLSMGRVSIPRQTFLDALPETYRGVLAEDSGVMDVQIPLQEVFQNLPGNALSIRHDQVVEEVGNPYPTPFAQKAEEDAQRLGVGTPTAPPAVEAAVETAPEAVIDTAPPVVEDPVAAEETPEAAGESFASIFEETSLDTTSVLPVESHPVSPEEPATEEPAAQAEPPRDIPLDLGGPVAEEVPAAFAAPEEPILAPVRDIHPPEETAVEPPVALEPTPVAEALAVLESTAPAEEAPTAAPAPALAAPAAGPVKAKAPAATAAEDSALQTLFMTEEALDAKGVVRHVCQLPGVTGCAVMFADGLRLAGNFPEGDAEGFSAMAPPFFKRSGNFAHEALLGTLGGITLYTNQGLVSFFMHDDICVSVRHTGRGFQPGVREKLGVVTRELARMYSSEKPADFGHSPL